MSVAPRELTVGESATVDGSLSCPIAADASGQTVTIYQHTADTPGFAVAGSTTTEADGSYRFITEALQTNSTFYATSQGTRSRPRIAVKAVPLVTIDGPPADTPLIVAGHRAGASAANTLTLSGTVSPADAGARVVLQRESAAINENWHRIGLGEVGADGQYSITHKFSIAGDATVRVVVRARGFLPSASEPISYEIAQRQNPRLTVYASAELLSYGQSVTLSGTAAQAAQEPLTLLARPPGGSFEPVATVTTDASGNYEFPAQSPLHSTVYRVTSAQESSTNLSEDVKPVLITQISSSSVQAGEQLTFSGTIAPDHAGRAIYLERQNPSGIGFHIVEVGTVSAESTYSITHTVSSAGTQVYRVKIPPNREGPGTASELFKIQVTPALAATLEPEAPGANSILPG